MHIDTPSRLVPLEWEGPLPLNEALKKTNNKVDYGIYQIYGHHIVFGPSSLLYIGRACEQPFASRLAQHGDWLRHESDLTIRLGRIPPGHYEDDAKGGWKDWTQLVKDVEALAIFWHSPPYNSSNINSYAGQPLRVQSWKNRGHLLPEFSSHWKPLRPPAELD
jgi:hypothetical protein